jgi:hypothetical protein
MNFITLLKINIFRVKWVILENGAGRRGINNTREPTGR